MRKFGIGISILCIAACTGFSQQKETFDLFITAGAGFGFGGRDVGASQTITNNVVTKETDHYLNYGSGLKIEGGASHKLMEHLYAQAALCYSNGLWGINRVIDDQGVDRVSEQYNYSTFGIKAMVKPMFQVLDLFDVYANFGLGLYFAGASIDRKVTIVGLGEYSGRLEESNLPALGIVGSIGVEYPINPSIIVFGELHCEQMSFLVTQTTITNSNLPGPGNQWANGVTNYEKNAVDRPAPYYTPGSNVAIRAGVRFPIF
jgi:hypothetical protein